MTIIEKHIHYSSLISDPNAYISEMFQLHPDAKHDSNSGEIEIINPIINSTFKYQLLEDGFFLFSFSSFSPVDAEYEFVPNPTADYFTLVFYITESRTKNPLYIKIDEKFYSSDQFSLFFNGKMNAEIFIKARQKAYGIRLDIHKKWFAENIENLPQNSVLAKILNFSDKGFVNTNCHSYHEMVKNLLSVFEKEKYPLQKLDLKSHCYSLTQNYLGEIFQSQPSETGKEKEKSGELQAALNYLEKNVLADFPGNDFLAELCHISESSFGKKFKNSFHISPAAYLKNLKMKEALRLLELGNNVKSVAHKIGYENVSAFGRSFKQIYGKSPASYVKM
ncbi:MAG: AraC family transcriptional regulator [Chitinophagaceae bacterium]